MKQPPPIFVATSAALDAGRLALQYAARPDAGFQQGELPLARLVVVPLRQKNRTPTRVQGAGSLASPAGPPEALASLPLPDSLITFWDELFCAVRTRLRQTVEPSARGPVDGPDVDDSPAAAQRMRDSVLDCVVALDQLHAALTHEAGRRRRIELALSHVHAELERVRAELASTQAGLPGPRSVAPPEAAASASRPGLFCVQATGASEPPAAPFVAPGPCQPSGYLLLHGGTGR